MEVPQADVSHARHQRRWKQGGSGSGRRRSLPLPGQTSIQGAPLNDG